MVSELQPYIKAKGRVNPVSILDIEEDINQVKRMAFEMQRLCLLLATLSLC